MKVAVLGLGSIGRRHARCFQEAGASSLVGMDPLEERRAQFLKDFDCLAVASEVEALASGPDLVVVASPNAYHTRQALLAVKAGCAVFVEKPLGVDLRQAEELASAVASGGNYFHMGSNWKFHPAFLRMKALIDEGAIGTPTGGQVLAGQWLPDWHPWEDYRGMYAARLDLGGGAIFDTHEIDYLTWLLGPVVSFCGLKARSGALEIETEDVAACVLRFANGALVSLLTDYIQRTSRRRYHLSGEGGTIEWDFHAEEITLCTPGARMSKRWAVGLANINDMYVAQARQVLDDIRVGRPSVTGIRHALEVLRIQEAWRAETAFDLR